MIAVAATPGNHVDYGSRCLSKLGLITGRQDLEFRDGLLVELGGRSTIDCVLIRLAVDHEVVISCSLAKHGRGIVGPLVSLAIHNHSRHKLKQVEIIAPVDRHILNLSRSDGSARRRRGGIN